VKTYGNYGRPIHLFEAYEEWRETTISEAVDEGLSLAEADSKADFPNFLFGPISYTLWQGYTRVQPQYQRYARVESLTDFRERRIRGLNALKGVGYVGDGGEYPQMRRTERGGPSLILDTYGGVYGITRQAIINDDSGELLNRNPDEMGYAMGIFVAESLIALIESNPLAYDGDTMSNVGRGNYTTEEMSEDSLADALSFMEQQFDDSGFRIVIRMANLVVQNARMQMRANRILRSQEAGTQVVYTGAAGAGTDVFDKGTMNPLAGILPDDGVIREPFYNDANDWRLFADPADVPAFALGFLNGTEEPFVGLLNPQVRAALGPGVDPYTYEFDTIDFKVRHDFGTAAVDFRGYFWGQVT
jgi:hypothetical protein